jgi:hypothetical protein
VLWWPLRFPHKMVNLFVFTPVVCLGIIFYLFCFVFSGIQHVLTERVTGDRNWLPFTSTWVHHWLFGGILVAHLFSFLLCFFLILFVFVLCRASMPCPHVANVSGFSIVPLVFSKVIYCSMTIIPINQF